MAKKNEEVKPQINVNEMIDGYVKGAESSS